MFKLGGWPLLTRRHVTQSLFSSHAATCHRCPCTPALPSTTSLCHCSATASLCVASRGVSSTHAAPSTSTPPSAPEAPRREVRRLRLKMPDLLTHEALSYAECPMCGALHHMRDMLFHIVAMHKDQDAEYWKEQCNSRLALYERVVGIPLAAVRQGPSPLDAALTVGVDPFQSMETSTRDPLKDGGAYRALMPTISSSGTYTCNWCTIKHAPFPSRDAFLMHVARDHPMLDFDMVESLVQLPPPPQEAKKKTTTNTEAAPLSWMPRDDGQSDASGGGAASSVGRTGPTRRMPGVKTVVESNATMVQLSARQKGLSVPRIAARGLDPLPLSSAASPNVDGDAAAEAESFFRPLHFPCELCNKVFASELNLLQHLEGKHAPPPLAATQSTTAAMAESALPSAADVAPPSPSATAAETKAEVPAAICVTCDLCRQPGRPFTMPSALFAHVRFSHRAVDATYEAERMMNEQKFRKPHSCPHCALRFPDATTLQSHLWEKHNKRVDLASLLGFDNVTVTEEAFALADTAAEQKSAWPTLPPYSPKARWWCDACRRGFSSANSLTSHCREKHNAVTELFPCPACRRVCTTFAALEAHVKASHKRVQLAELGVQPTSTCADCNRCFLSYEALHEHCVRHHGKDPRSPVRSFSAPSSAAVARGVSAVVDGAAAPAEIAAPSKPRKVSRPKKASSTTD